jgi:hypothetical protein
MPLFSMDVIRARKGDCLMLHFGGKSEPRLVMIDGGPSDVYHPHLKPRIDLVRAARGLEDNEPLPVDVLMVSHIDDDHIKGLLDMTRELRDLKEERSPLFIRVATLWHNTFDDLLKTTAKELKAEASFGLAAVNGQIDLSSHEEFDAAKVLASIPQGRALRDDAEFFKWPINRQFKGDLIIAKKKPKTVALDGGLKFTVVGPLQPELEALQEEHDKFLRKKKKTKTAAAALAAFVDESIPNLSSLVLLAEVGGKTMLLTGDARGDKILEGLEMAGLMDGKGKIKVDLLKGPHHGSDNNVAPEFFERIMAKHYVFSGNGEHGNPERDTLQMLLDARGDADYQVHITYPIDEIDPGRKAEWEKQRAREQKRGAKKVRAKWSNKKHSLAAFMADNKAFAKKVRIVPDGKPHLIDLLDKVKLK